ncbi:hypothetical protein [Mesorhizobium sp. Z1-4]|uniref:hypothetical protein n=1 Tax=Mesorhizobium sp. Z1-4 TaxID=2448478 RepID=UPI000FD9DD11|nr:hypothetical protein [Mesorhizobium sp. Z1-4]
MTSATAKTDFDIVTRWRMEARAEELSEIILDPEIISRWGTSVFMACEVVERGAPDGLGMEVRLFTKGFLPHSFFFVGKVTGGEAHRWMDFDISGDFVGRGRMHVEPDGPDHLAATFRWTVDVAHPWVRRFVKAIHPVFVWNHTWAVGRLSRMMQAEVYRRRARDNAIREPVPTFPHNLVPFRRWQQRRFSSRGWLGGASSRRPNVPEAARR